MRTLAANPKYKGFNVRNKFSSENLFTESKVKYVRKENWVVMENERIEPLISSELWEAVQKAQAERCLHGNKGTNSRKYDIRGKVVCKCCGGAYIRAVEKRVIDKPQGKHYLICSQKKGILKNIVNLKTLTLKC